MKLVGRFLSVIIVLGALAALCMPADAGAYLYSGKRKRIYCGIVEIVDPLTGNVRNNTAINSVTQTVTNPDGSTYVTNLFAKLDSMNNMKPAGWTFENPLALSQNKLDPNYWRVRVGSARNLSRLNVLYFPGSGNITLTDQERENLRRFVDGGGVLWVDNVNATSTLQFGASGPFFIGQLGFSTGVTGADVAVSRHHPLLCTPFWMTDVEITSLGMNASGSWTRCYCDMPSPGVGASSQPVLFDVLYPVIDAADPMNGALAGEPAVMANTYGGGRVVATANGVGRGCMMTEPYSLASLKFAFNIMSYAASWTDLRKDPRHSGSSIDTLGSNRLVEKWVLETPTAVAGKENAAMIYKNTVFYTSGSTLFALEQNGDTNNGMYSATPTGAVIIWQWNDPNGGKLSAPTVATIQNPDPNDRQCAPIEAVLVMDDAGKVFVLPAFPLDLSGMPITPIAPLYDFDTAGGSSTDGKWPCPPVAVNGWIYALGGQGRLWATNPCLKKWADNNTGAVVKGAAPVWQSPDLTTPFSASPKCGPSFGYMKNGSSGAVVGMVYWFDSKSATPAAAPGDQNDHLCGVPVSVSMDRVRILHRDAAGTRAELVVSYPGHLAAPDPDHPESAVRMFQSDGITPITVTATLNQNMAGSTVPGCITIQTATAMPTNPLIYGYYSVSYGMGIPASKLDMEIEPKSVASTVGGGALSHPPTLIPGTPCMGPDNMIYTCGARDKVGPAGGSILAYQNDGGSGSSGKLKWHYFLHSGLDATDSASFMPGINVQLPGVVQGPSGPMINPQPCSSPVVAGDKLFVAVSGDAGGPRGALLCLKANPEFVIRITESAGYNSAGKPIQRPKSLWRKTDGGHYTVKVWQPNLINAPSGGIPLMDARTVSTGIDVDYDHGTITFTDFGRTKLQYRNMADTNTFSPSLPVWVWLDNVEVPIDWSTWGPGATTGSTGPASSDSVDLSGWNNLLWYYIVPDSNGTPCSGVHSPPVVIGNAVYFVTDDGVLYALDTDTGETTSKETKKDPIWAQDVTTGGASLGADSAASVSGSNGVLMVPAADGLHAFTNTTTLVADNNRIVELDGGGEVTWAVDSISWPATIPTTTGGGMAIKQGPVNKPGRARYASTGEILFANSGTNQVCKIDKAGMVGFDGASGKYVRWIYTKFVDPRHLLRSGQPTQLSGPTDAIMWQEMEPAQTSTTAGTSVVHCLIADSGNSRILDLVYRVKGGQFVDYNGDPITIAYNDNDSGFVMPELNWVSKTDSLNERYAFDCLQLVTNPPASGPSGTVTQQIWVASSNFTSNGTGDAPPQGGAGLGGAILALDYRERSIGSGAPGDWNYESSTSGTIVARCDRIDLGGGSIVPLANPRYIDVIDTPAGRSVMVCDNYGVYQVALAGSAAPSVVRHLWEADYRAIPRSFGRDSLAPAGADDPLPEAIQVPFQPTSVQRLPNGRWLIANSYSGSNSSGAITFGGEVFEFDPSLASGAPPEDAIRWSSPRLQRIWDTTNNVWGQWKQTTTNTYDLKQPKSAMRHL